MGQARSSENNTPENVFRVVVKTLDGQKLLIDLCDTEEQFKTITVLQLKEKLREHTGRSPGSDYIRLTFRDRQLNEDSTPLCDYGIQHLSEIHMDVHVPGGGELPGKGDGGMGDKDKNRMRAHVSGYDNVKVIDNAQLLEDACGSLAEYGIKYRTRVRLVRHQSEAGGFAEKGEGGIGDKDKSKSMEKLSEF